MTDEISLQKFLSEAANHRLLTAHEEKALGRRSQAGDRTARNELVLCNIRLVISIARYYRNRGLAMEDVIQEGIIGLNRAAEKFDPDREIRFSTYATLWIKQAIQRGLQNTGIAIRLPYAVSSIRGKVRAAQAKHPDEDINFIADLLDLDVEDVQAAIDAAEVVTSIDREVTTDEHMHTILDAMSDPFAEDPFEVVEDDLTDELRAAVKQLDTQYRRVVEMHFGLNGKPPMSVKEIAAKLGLNSENTVKARRTKGLALLAQRLEHHR